MVTRKDVDKLFGKDSFQGVAGSIDLPQVDVNDIGLQMLPQSNSAVKQQLVADGDLVVSVIYPVISNHEQADSMLNDVKQYLAFGRKYKIVVLAV